ncbi:carboxypeptidase-like regulatory domain-containing protein [Corynebacterium pyruviciproducens]|uniref:carboxypeptidase-like regulatory domain-containing protein n=1 Tax=Corynebacterium pyruviciproducens TaxID=598660 RepID=UPI00254CB9BF|nr:fibronectin type III domain-containing protein [Corynebacterium pyruviciproducens]MDK7215031.1 fibronectin type III domain-containing protein [Corynebacterium pyruviciproducens]
MRKTAFLTAVAMAASLVVAPSVASAGDNGNGFYNVVVGPGTDESSATITWDETHLLPTGVDFNGDSKKDFSSKRLGSSTLSNRFGVFYHKKAVVTGLNPGQQYTFRLGTDLTWSPEMTFTAGTASSSWSFAATGAPDVLVDDASWADTVAAAAATHPELLVVTGNAMSNKKSNEERDTFTDTTLTDLIPTAVGYHTDDTATAADTSWHFSFPGDQKLTTSFTHNNVGFINVATAVSGADLESFITSEAERLSASTDWIVLYGMQKLTPELQKIASQAGVDLILSGGTGYYSRSYLLNASGVDKAAGPTVHPKDGQMLFVSLNAPADMGRQNPTNDPATFAKAVQDGTPDYTTVDVTPEELTVTTRDVATGKVIDAVTLSRKPEIKPGPIASEDPTTPAETTPTSNKPTSEPKPTSEKPTSEPKPTSNKPTSEPKPTTEKPTSEPKPTSNKPTSKPKPSDKPTSEPKPSDKPSEEPTPVPAPMLKPGTTVEKVTPGKKAVLDDVVTGDLSSVTGSVTDASGTSVAGATVSVDKETGTVSVTLPKDAKAGTYTIQLASAGKNVGAPITVTVEAKSTPTPKPTPKPGDDDQSSEGSSSEDMVWIGVGGFFGMIAVAGIFGWLLGNVLGHARPYLEGLGIHI